MNNNLIHSSYITPLTLLYNHVKENKKSRNLTHEVDQNLIQSKEKKLVSWITYLTITDYPSQYQTLQEMAEEISKRCVKDINENDMQLIEYDNIGRDWVQYFLQCHSELENVKPWFIDEIRLKNILFEWL